MVRKNNKGRKYSARTKSKSGKASSNYGNRSGWGTSYGSPSGRTARKHNTRSKTVSCAPGYSTVNNMFQQKVQNFRMLWDQTRGTAMGNRPSPATLKTFGNWINKGANIWKVSNSQIKRWCKTNQMIKTSGAAKTALCNKFGKSTIKAVTCAKTGGFIVATAPTCKGKTFNFPK